MATLTTKFDKIISVLTYLEAHDLFSCKKKVFEINKNLLTQEMTYKEACKSVLSLLKEGKSDNEVLDSLYAITPEQFKSNRLSNMFLLVLNFIHECFVNKKEFLVQINGESINLSSDKGAMLILNLESESKHYDGKGVSYFYSVFSEEDGDLIENIFAQIPQSYEEICEDFLNQQLIRLQKSLEERVGDKQNG